MKRAALLLYVAVSERGKLLAGQGDTVRTDIRTLVSALERLIFLQCSTALRTANCGHTAKRTQLLLRPNLRFPESNARHVFLASETSIHISGVRSAGVHTGKRGYRQTDLIYISRGIVCTLYFPTQTQLVLQIST
jgi:hypothetical protein